MGLLLLEGSNLSHAGHLQPDGTGLAFLPGWSTPVSPGASRAAMEESAQRLVLAELNAQRVRHGLSALSLDARLSEASQRHADYMAARGTLTHTGENGSTPGQRFQAAGYAWRSVAENIAAGQESPSEVVQAWMGSPGHRQNILNPNLRHIGLGVRGTYWVLALASP